MQSMIRFSLFGNYEKFNTNNLDFYMKLIDFFGRKGYKPATANELQLQSNGQPKMLIMPVFLNDTGAVIEMMSNRINFQKNINNDAGIVELKEAFTNEFSKVLDEFIEEMEIVSNRVALNCDVLKSEITTDMPIQSCFFENENKTEMSVKNVARKKIEKEDSNMIIEKYVAVQGGFTKYSYDINSLGENQLFRFDINNIKKMYEAYTETAIEIEKGLK